MDDLLIYSGYFVLLINLILYTFSFFHQEKANVFFMVYLVFIFIIQFIMEIMYYLHMNNLFAINLFFVGQMIFLGLFYESILKTKKQKFFVKLVITSILLVLFVQYFIEPDQFLKFNLFEITLTSLSIVVFALLHFYNMLSDKKEYYYYTIGVVFYLLTSTVLYLVGNLTSNLGDDLKYLSWRLNAFLILMYYLFILYEWKVSFKSKKEINTYL
ncbi:hypothetical protein RC62_3128 [Flavobacterium aquidurense]|uniref:Uncharacterized protein n=1 Tax=Flavobacterium aquidurense TaxID=362413 RepID=A0A0Q0X3G1_9FLAO|nr:hypothetical protein RC62_3128 [Flavobacterium aquidurense]